MKKALITEVTEQYGSYLAEFLLSKEYEVHGIIRRCSIPNLSRIEHLIGDDRPFFLHFGDMGDGAALHRIVQRILPDEVYNLAALSDVQVSFELPEYTADVNATGLLRLL